MRDWVKLKYSVCFYRITVQYNSVAHCYVFLIEVYGTEEDMSYTHNIKLIFCRIIPLQGFTFQ